MRQIFATMLLCTTIFASSCNKEESSIAVEKVILNKTSLDLEVNQQETLTATVLPTEVENKSVTWSSDDDEIVAISENGVVSAKNITLLPVKITATSVADPAKTVHCMVSVKAKNIVVTEVTLNTTALSINLGESYNLEATVVPSNATNKSVTWSTSNAEIASVSNTGVVTANKASDTSVIITATSVADPTKKATCEVTVKIIAVTGITLDKTTLSMKVGRTQALVATVAPKNATNKAVTWSTSNAEIASVSNTGVVTANKASDTPVIITTTSVADPTKKATCEVIVEETDMISNYFYEDGTISAVLDKNKICIGIVFWEDPDNAGHGLIVGLEEKENIKTWDDALIWAAAKTDGGLTWSCPNKEQLQYLYCTYIGAAPTTWADKSNKPESVTNPTSAALFGNSIISAGGAPIDANAVAKYYWSSVEFDAKQAWYVNFKSGYIGTLVKSFVRVRPIAAF